eukprot:CAMPEP_0115733386 /NCGR_PEP_ID=MMETSP0272-20121206/85630_1 /TAXON_ID=71861 /ORGANISM="Scrippsiella trochoidea, Strain CCMP3099" /LENGTH=126 /DNA_ID=CAMNT_0003177365 /DNA_START=340 /DNA_END=718 /DNA_ORIENTATION=+
MSVVMSVCVPELCCPFVSDCVAQSFDEGPNRHFPELAPDGELGSDTSDNSSALELSFRVFRESGLSTPSITSLLRASCSLCFPATIAAAATSTTAAVAKASIAVHATRTLGQHDVDGEVITGARTQ